jgi:hypothetical protein
MRLDEASVGGCRASHGGPLTGLIGSVWHAVRGYWQHCGAYAEAEEPVSTLIVGGRRILITDFGPPVAKPLPAGDRHRATGLVNTSTHIRNVHAKFQAQDRSSAIQRAREMRLLSAGRTV